MDFETEGFSAIISTFTGPSLSKVKMFRYRGLKKLKFQKQTRIKNVTYRKNFIYAPKTQNIQIASLQGLDPDAHT